MKNKFNYFIILISTFLLFSFGCSEEFLEEKALTFYTEDNFYTTPEAMDLGVVHFYSDAMNNLGTNISFLLASDLGRVPMYSANVGGGYTNVVNGSYSGGIWVNYYQAINRINTLMSHIDGIKWKSEEQKNRIKGNALFFRTMYYLRLAIGYGEIPIVTEPVTSAKTDFIRNSRAEVVAQLIKDAKEASEILPQFGTRKGEIGRGAAQHLLTHVYLYAKQWDKAEQTATSLITSGDYRLMTERFGVNKDKPGTAYSDLFLDGNVNRYEGNYESLYVWQAADMYQTKGAGMHPKMSALCKYQNVPGFTLSMEYWQRGKGYFILSPYVINELFDPKNPMDDRGSDFAIFRSWRFNDAAYIAAQKAKGTPLTQVVDGKTVEVQVGDLAVITDANRDNLWPVLVKWMDNFTTNLTETMQDKCFACSRLAETYLFRAEARFKQGNLQGAADDINTLRRRAHAPEVSASDINMNFILAESAKELIGEQWRQLELMRTGKIIEINELYNPNSRGYISAKDTLFPIPTSEIDRMKDSPYFPQNPGW